MRRLLDLGPDRYDTALVVQQLTRTEPGCPPLETVIAVPPSDGPARRWTPHRPADQVTKDDLRVLFTTAPKER